MPKTQGGFFQFRLACHPQCFACRRTFGLVSSICSICRKLHQSQTAAAVRGRETLIVGLHQSRSSFSNFNRSNDMNFALRTLVIATTLALTACAAYEPVPKEYTGATATLRDSGYSEDDTKAQLFAAMEVDGNPIRNAFGATANASQGRGASISTVLPSRKVKAAPMKVAIKGSHATGAPIAAIGSQLAGTFFAVDGVVDFSPSPDGIYIVRGELKKGKSSVWIEDSETGKAVTAVISK
jgi:hypothetical protein